MHIMYMSSFCFLYGGRGGVDELCFKENQILFDKKKLAKKKKGELKKKKTRIKIKEEEETEEGKNEKLSSHIHVDLFFF